MAINSVSGKMIRQKDKIDHDNRLLGMVTSGKGHYRWKYLVADGYGLFGYGMVMGGSTEKRGDREGGRGSIIKIF